MSRYGDTPEGMVESAMEFLRICEDEKYYNIVLSMKSSNPQVMVQAYRLLVKQMMKENMNYPLHLGVTEAGDGEDGRIKSSIGIGTLLEEGLGDTVRVSLTEEPEFEIPVCKTLVDRYTNFSKSLTDTFKFSETINPFEYSRRKSITINNIGGKNVPVVILTANDEIIKSHEALREVGYYYSESLDKWNIGDMAPDYIYLGSENIKYNLPGTLKKIFDYDFWKTLELKSDSFPLLNTNEYILTENINFNKFLEIEINNLSADVYNKISSDKNIILVIKSDDSLSYLSTRELC